MGNEFRYLSDQRPISLLVITANVELPFSGINLHISDDKIQTSVYYKEIETLSILITAYMLSLTASFSACVACSYSGDFLMRSREMLTFFSLRGYPCASLVNNLRRVSTINLPGALYLAEQNDGTMDRVPLVLTYK